MQVEQETTKMVLKIMDEAVALLDSMMKGF